MICAFLLTVIDSQCLLCCDDHVNKYKKYYENQLSKEHFIFHIYR